jgi:tetratricopeptide (TPR) repeat protein
MGRTASVACGLALCLGLLCLAGCMNGRRWHQAMDAGRAAQAAGRLDEAARHFATALELARPLPAEHPCVTESLDRLGAVYYLQGRPAEAEPLFRRLATALERILGPGHPTLARSLHSLAEVQRAQGRLAEAEGNARRALAIWERTLGPRDATTAVGLDSLGRVLHAGGRFAAAEEYYRRAVAVREALAAGGGGRRELAETLGNLADVVRRQGRGDEADQLAARARTLAGAGGP